MKINLNIPHLNMTDYLFEIDEHTTVEKLKTLIEEGCEIPVSQQELFCGSTELKNEQNIAEICKELKSVNLTMRKKTLTNESVIKEEKLISNNDKNQKTSLPPVENIKKEGEDREIVITYDNGKKQLKVWVNNSCTVKQLKELIWIQHKIPVLKIIYRGGIADDKKNLNELDTRKEYLTMVPQKKEEKVIVNDNDVRSNDKDFEKYFKIHEYRALNDKENLSELVQEKVQFSLNLSFAKKEEKNESVINNNLQKENKNKEELIISNNDRNRYITNLFKMKGTDDPRPIENTKKEGEDFLITIRYDGKDLYLWINKSYSLAQLKESLRDQHKIPVEGQKIIYCGRALNDKENLTVLKFDDLKNPPKLNLSFAKKEEKNVIKDNLNHTLLGGSNSPPEEKEVKKDFRNKI